MTEDRADLIDEIVDLYEAKYGAKGEIKNREGWRRATLAKLTGQTDEWLVDRRNSMVGNPNPSLPHGRDTPAGKNYAYRDLDHAITDAAYLLGRIEGATGQRCHTDRDIQVVLTDQYGAEVAGRALALATDGLYAVQMARYAPAPKPIDEELITYGEYLRRGGQPPQDPTMLGQ